MFRLLIVFLCMIFPLSAFAESSSPVRTLRIHGDNWELNRIHNLVASGEGNQKSFVLRENSLHQDASVDLLLDFESSLTNLPNYRVLHSDFLFNHYQNTGGLFSGKFSNSKNWISLYPLDTSIFAPGKVPGSFTIEFWVYFYKGYDHQILMQYLGNNPSDEKDDNVYGFEIHLQDQHLVYKFQNFFWSIQNDPYSISISEDENIRLNHWEHHAISFNLMTGKLSTYKNGIEQQVKWVTTDGRQFSPIYNPYIMDQLSTPFIIARNAFFSLDNLIISKKGIENFNLNRFATKPATLITGTYKLSENLSTLKSLDFDLDLTNYSFAKTAYRISDHYFLAGNKEIPWIYVRAPFQNFPASYNQGKYIQFKIELLPYEQMNEKIAIRGIDLDYTSDETPSKPIFLSAKAENSKIKLTWIPNTEDDVVAYVIYYGNRSGFYICNQAADGVSPIKVPFHQEGRLKPIEYELTGLKNDTPFFISIRSMDANGNLSDYSREIYARPSDVFDDDAYSIEQN